MSSDQSDDESYVYESSGDDEAEDARRERGAGEVKVENENEGVVLHCRTSMQVPNSKVDRLIGRNGSSINNIREGSGCTITNDESLVDIAERVFTIIGTLEQTQEALRLIQARLQEN